MRLDLLIARLQEIQKQTDTNPYVNTAWHGGIALVRADKLFGSITVYGFDELPDDLPPTDRCVKTLGSPECGVDLSKFAPGDGEAECDKTYDCCRLRFDNGVRFGGSPKVPKRDGPDKKPTG